MRTIDSSALVKKPSNLAWWHSSWTGRLVLAALLVAAAALVLMPNGTSAQETNPQLDADELCQIDNTASSTNLGIIEFSDAADATAAGEQPGLISDCRMLVALANALQDDATVGGATNWIDAEAATLQVAGALLVAATDDSAWTGVTVEDTDDDDTANPRVYRVTAINLSGQGLSGDIPRSVWEHFAGRLDGDLDNNDTADDPELNLSNNPDLAPSPPLGLTADVKSVTGEDDAETVSIDLSWDHTGWYTQAEPTTGAVITHSYQYCGMASCEDDDWMDATVTYTDADGMAIDTTGNPPADTPNDKGDRANLAIPDLAAANTYVVQVRAKKATADDPATTGDDANEMATALGAASRLDPVGPQTLTAESMYSLNVAVVYTATEESEDEDDDTRTFKVEVLDDEGAVDAEAAAILTIGVDSREMGGVINFNPTAVGNARVTLGQPHGTHTFPVEILASTAAPDIIRVIRNMELVDRKGETRINLLRHFEGEDLSFTAESSRENIATVRVDGSSLYITTLRLGQTHITVTATDGVTRGSVQDEFRVTVIDPNNAPFLAGNIPDLTLYLDDTGTQVDMRQYFRDDDNDFLRFIPQSANPKVVTATVVGPTVTFNVVGLGEARMTIIAQDGRGGETFGSFTITVLDPNFAPEAVGQMPPQEIRVDGPVLSLDVAQYFSDANNDPLTYTARSSDDDILAVEIEGSTLSLTAVAAGEATVTVRATDPGGKSGSQEMVVIVLPANNAPVAAATFQDQVLQSDDNPLGLDLNTYFTDPDGHDMRFIAESSDEAVATASVQGDNLTVVPVAAGETTITVTAVDEVGASFSMSFMVTVVANVSPVAVGVIEDQVVLEGGDDLVIALDEYFSDENGDALTYTAESSNAEAVNPVILENYIFDLANPDPVTVLALRPGTTDLESVEVTVTVTATDPDGESATQVVMVTLLGSTPPPTATPMPEPTATPAPTEVPATATPAPTATPEPEEGGFPIAVVVIIVLLLAGAAAVVFIIQRRR